MSITAIEMKELKVKAKAFVQECKIKDQRGQLVEDAYQQFRKWHLNQYSKRCTYTKAQFGRALPRAKYPRYITRKNYIAGVAFKGIAFSW